MFTCKARPMHYLQEKGGFHREEWNNSEWPHILGESGESR